MNTIDSKIDFLIDLLNQSKKLEESVLFCSKIDEGEVKKLVVSLGSFQSDIHSLLAKSYKLKYLDF